MTAGNPPGAGSVDPRTPLGNPVLGLVLIIVFVIAGLSGLDRFLAQTEMAEVQRAARRSYLSGIGLLENGKPAPAVDPLRNAHALVRQNPEYELGLISALMAVGKTDEADPLMDEALEQRPNDGQTNLIAGRLRVKEEKIPEAESYYHRAIYGEWPSDPATHRVSTRMELIQLLVKERAHQELLAELISVEAEAPENVAFQKQAAQLFLIAGAPPRAANVYRALVAKDPEDPQVYAGLGEAELEQGEYRAARGAFLQASYHHPDASVEPRLELVNTLTGLDPTPRQLPSMEKYERSLRILDLARADLARHIAENPSVMAAHEADGRETAELLKTALDAASQKTPQHVTNELAERSLALAEKIWKTRIRIFGAVTSRDEEALRLIMEKLIA